MDFSLFSLTTETDTPVSNLKIWLVSMHQYCPYPAVVFVHGITLPPGHGLVSTLGGDCRVEYFGKQFGCVLFNRM